MTSSNEKINTCDLPITLATPHSPGQANRLYRIDALKQELELNGFVANVVDINALSVVGNVVIFHRPSFCDIDRLRELHGMNVKLYIDLDDLCVDERLLPERMKRYSPVVELARATERCMEYLSGAIVSTSHLGEMVRSVSDIPIFLRKNVMPIEKLLPSRFARLYSSPQLIAYTSGAHHDEDLALCGKALLRTATRADKVGFRTIGTVTLPRWEEEGEWWQDADEWPSLRYDCLLDLLSDSCQIGVVPLVDDDWNRSKSLCKWMEYTVAGLAVVASPVGEYAELKQGWDLLHAVTMEDWMRELRGLLKDPVGRTKLVQHARSTLLREFTTVSNTFVRDYIV